MDRPTVIPKNIPGNLRFLGSKAVQPVPAGGQYNNKQLKEMFKCHDANGDGRLSKEELIKAFASLGSFAPRWRAFRALRHADKNRDGYINDDELDYLVKYAAKRGYTIS